MSLKGEQQTDGTLDFESPHQGDVFEVLSNERRRLVLRALRRHEEGSVDLGVLAEQVAAWENDVDPNAVTYDQRKRVYTALQQTHLPMMDEAGAIRFHDRQGRVEWVEETDDFDYYLTVVPRGTFLFSHYYTLIGVVSTLVGVLIGLELIAIPLVPELVFPGIIIGIFAVLSAVHIVHRKSVHWDPELGEGADR